LKKILVLTLVMAVSFVGIPFGYGIWNESIGIHGQIKMAEVPCESIVEPLVPTSGEALPVEDANSQPEPSQDTPENSELPSNAEEEGSAAETSDAKSETAPEVPTKEEDASKIVGGASEGKTKNEPEEQQQGQALQSGSEGIENSPSSNDTSKESDKQTGESTGEETASPNS